MIINGSILSIDTKSGSAGAIDRLTPCGWRSTYSRAPDPHFQPHCYRAKARGENGGCALPGGLE
jgi:hypothetical protein